ncbi:hypothetical protein FHS29_002363 [Saccharothrix tamanrassetensis]|uniref:Uncharacterized protein n=1 Tax=Saccharothrix tamanrassetensis TaxID=1051531 RepID=A0A841CB86_9PSEU|nr:hypothetical protein [Saccharothrix tamanrassetensis]MBB5955782.1 hypothetical protein [Saccharothrix tamanrassetensis]
MDPISGLTAGGHSMSGRLTYYVALQLTSVVLPGAVALTELTLLGVHFYPHQGHDVTFLLSGLAKVQGSGAILFAALGIGASFVIGYATRATGFALTGRVERAATWLTRRRNRPVHSDLARVRHVLGDDLADELPSLHPALRHVDPATATAPTPATARAAIPATPTPDTPDTPTPDTPETPTPDAPTPGAATADDLRTAPTLPAGGAHRGDGSVHAFEYSKLWLRRFSPVLNVDSMEIEINILVSTVLPFALAAVEAVVFPRLPPAFRLVVVGVCVVAVVVVLRQAIRLRQAERWYAIRNVAFDLSMRRAATRYPEAIEEPGTQPG